MTISFLTANDLRTGQIVYWTPESVWSLEPSQAALAHTDEEHEGLEAVLSDPEMDLHVVGAYLVKSHGQAAEQVVPSFPKKLRESHRLAGPTDGLLPPQIAA